MLGRGASVVRAGFCGRTRQQASRSAQVAAARPLGPTTRAVRGGLKILGRDKAVVADIEKRLAAGGALTSKDVAGTPLHWKASMAESVDAFMRGVDKATKAKSCSYNPRRSDQPSMSFTRGSTPRVSFNRPRPSSRG